MSREAHDITVVGLGSGDSGVITREVGALLRDGHVYLRTRIHPALESLPESANWPSFDDVYRRFNTFEEVSATIVNALVEAAKNEPIIYAVPGHPLFGDATVRLLLESSRRHELSVQIIPAVSFLDAIIAQLELDPVAANLQLVDALELMSVNDAQPYAGGRMPLSPLRPAVVAQIHSPAIALAVKLALLRRYPEEFEVTFVTLTGAQGRQIRSLRLSELDGQRVDHLSCLYIPAMDYLSGPRVAEGLQRIVARLRAPGGCPWDREQTHDSLTRHMLEEAYEVIHAIENGSSGDLAEELGDVLLQVYLHAQIAEEAGDFALEDVIQTLSTKLVRRHPHVFGDRTIETAGEVVKAWDQIKQEERTTSSDAASESPFSSIPMSLPALARVQTMLRRAHSHGLDADKLMHRPATNSENETDDHAESIASRIVKLVAEAEESGVDAERALRQWTTRFERTASTAHAQDDN